MADGKVIYEIRGDTSHLDGDIKGAEGKFSGLASGVGKALAGAAVAVGAAATAVVGSVITVGSDFEAQMSKVQAVSGATSDELAKLEQQAIDLGASSVFSASEAAGAQENLASLGFNTNEIMAAMPGLLDAAASSGTGLAETAQIVAGSLNGFGLEAKDAGHLADVFAQSAAQTGADFSGLGEAMQYVAADAAAMGLSLEETTAVVGVLSDANKMGSEAGTGLRSVLSSLREPTDSSVKAMKQLGLYTEETGNAFYNSKGEFVGMNEATRLLTEATAGLTQEEANAALGAMFSTQAMTAVNILMQEGTGTIDALTESYKECDGAAAEMAGIMNDNLQGALNETSGKLETIQLKLYEGLEPALKSGAEAFNGFLEDFMQEGGLDQLIEIFSQFGETLSEALVDILPIVLDLFNKFLPIISMLLDRLLPPLIDLFETLIEPLMEIIDEVLPPIIDLFIDLLEPLTEILKKVLPPLVDIFKKLIPPLIEILDEILPPLIDVFMELIDPIMELVDLLLPLLVDLITLVADVMEPLMPIIEAVAGFLVDVLGGAIKFITGIIEDVVGAIRSAINWFKELLGLDTSGAASKVPSTLTSNRKYAKGLERVPFDDFPALLHEGEMVMPATEAHLYRSGLGRAGQSDFMGSGSVDDHSTTVGSLTINPNAQQWSELMKLLSDTKTSQIRERAR